MTKKSNKIKNLKNIKVNTHNDSYKHRYHEQEATKITVYKLSFSFIR